MIPEGTGLRKRSQSHMTFSAQFKTTAGIVRLCCLRMNEATIIHLKLAHPTHMLQNHNGSFQNDLLTSTLKVCLCTQAAVLQPTKEAETRIRQEPLTARGSTTLGRGLHREKTEGSVSWPAFCRLVQTWVNMCKPSLHMV